MKETVRITALSRRARNRDRWIQGALIFVALGLGIKSFSDRFKLESVRIQLEENHRIKLIDEARRLSTTQPENWLKASKDLLNSARQIRSDFILRTAWASCLAKASPLSFESPAPCQVLDFPVSLRSRIPALLFTADSLRLKGFSDQHQLEWVLEKGTSPQLENFSGPTPEALICARPTGSRLEVSVGLLGFAVIRDTVSGGVVMQLRGPRNLYVDTVAWSPDGHWIATTGFPEKGPSAGPQVVYLWNMTALRTGLAEINLNWHDESPAALLGPTLLPTLRFWCSWETFGWMALMGMILAVSLHQNQTQRRYQKAASERVDRAAELQQSLAKMVHSENLRTLGTVAAGVAHDLNNLLSVIQLSRQILERNSSIDDKAREYLGNIGQAVELGRSIVQGVLGYSRETPSKGGDLSLSAVIDETLRLLGQQILGGIQFTIDVAKDLPEMQVNSRRLEQILINLVSNAVDAMNGLGRLDLTVGMSNEILDCVLRPPCPGPWIKMSLTDTGIGIDPEVFPQIFEPFFTTKSLSPSHGTGMGLATVWRIASEEGLGLSVKSSQQFGTCFQVFLPIVQSQ